MTNERKRIGCNYGLPMHRARALVAKGLGRIERETVVETFTVRGDPTPHTTTVTRHWFVKVAP